MAQVTFTYETDSTIKQVFLDPPNGVPIPLSLDPGPDIQDLPPGNYRVHLLMFGGPEVKAKLTVTCPNPVINKVVNGQITNALGRAVKTGGFTI